MNRQTRRRPLLLIPLVVLLIAPLASAGLIVQLDSVTLDQSFPGDFRWSYSLTIPAGDGCLFTECFFTIYDFRGIVTVEAPNNFGAQTPLVGVTPSGVTPTDDPSIKNVTFTHCGFQGGCGEIGPTTISHFDIISTFGNIASGQFSGQDSDGYPGPVTDHSLQGNLGAVGVPSVTSSVPEPSSMILVASGLAGLAGAAWKARRRPRCSRAAA